jgi:toxin YoeB
VKLVWDEHALDDYVWWQIPDRRVLKRINALIKDVERNGNEGIQRGPDSHRGVQIPLRNLRTARPPPPRGRKR